MKTRCANVVFLNVILFIFLSVPVYGGAWNESYCQASPIPCEKPEIILQSVNTSTSIIYTNNTSAKVTVQNKTNSLDVLQITNQTSGQWKLQLIKYDETNIARLTNCTIWFHDGNASVQIKILNGSYNQTSGDFYDFVPGISNYITITASTNATGTSYIYTYLKILKPNTSTYALYIITFEIT